MLKDESIIVKKTLKKMKEEIVDNDEILIFVNGIRKNIKLSDLKKDYADKIEKLQKDSLNYMGGNELKILKTEFPEISGST